MTHSRAVERVGGVQRDSEQWRGQQEGKEEWSVTAGQWRV